MFGAARGYLQPTVQYSALFAESVEDLVEKARTPVMDEQRRYARLLQSELGRQHMTNAEREDSAAIDRVRDALYGD